MKNLRNAVVVLAATLSSVFSQSSSLSCDSDSVCFESYTTPQGVKYGFLFPTNVTKYPNEFMGQFTVPIAGKWVGAALGEGMNGNLLLLAWPNNGTIVYSTRQAENYAPPTTYTGPKVTTLATVINATYWTWTYRCQNCTTWTIDGRVGDIAMSSGDVFGWAYSSTPVSVPSDPNSALQRHDDADLYGFNATQAETAKYGSILLGFKKGTLI